MVFASLGFAADSDKNSSRMSADMREAIAFQRAKDRADARQARIEARHPTVFYNNANRSADRTGNPVRDAGPSKKDQR
jgi:hypothetical protein